MDSLNELHPAKTRHGNDLVFVRSYQKWKNLLNIVKIPKKLPKHLLIFSSAQYNHIVGGMMKKREGQKIEKLKFKLDLNFCDFREECGS